MLGYRSRRDDRLNSHQLDRVKGISFLALSFLSFGVFLLSVGVLTVSLLGLFDYTPEHRRFTIAVFAVTLIHSLVLGCFAFQFGVRHLRAGALL